MKVYYAAPMFSAADQAFNAKVAGELRENFPDLDIYVPQEQEDINDKSKYADSKMIAQVDTDKVMESDLMIAVLDGVSIDPGVAAEVGIAYAEDIPMVGLYTDVRTQGADVQEKLDALQVLAESQFPYVNLYVVGLIKLKGKVVGNIPDLMKVMEEIL